MSKKTFIIILIIAVLITSGVYVLSANRQNLVPKNEREIQNYEQTSSSDDVDDIEKDLEETDLENIDSELLDISSELEMSTND